MSKKNTVLVIDDENDLRELVSYNLETEGYNVITASDGLSGVALAKTHQPNIVILDVMMPGIDGFEVCRRLRSEKETEHVPVILLTAKAEELDKVVGFELGADDYMTKPFSVRELLVRIKAMLRRTTVPLVENSSNIIELGPLKIDESRHYVYAGKKKITLTLTEFNILKTLAERDGKVLNRDDLISVARGFDVMVSDRTIDVHIASLRKKLGKYSKLIETVRGKGYRSKISE